MNAPLIVTLSHTSLMRYAPIVPENLSLLFLILLRSTVGVLAPSQIPKLESYPLSAVRNSIQNIRCYAQKLEAVPAIRSTRTHQGVVTTKRAKMEQTENMKSTQNQSNYNPSDSIHHNTSRAKMTMMMNCCYFRRRRGARAQHEGSGHLYHFWTSPEGNYSSKSSKHSQYPGITDLSLFL